MLAAAPVRRVQTDLDWIGWRRCASTTGDCRQKEHERGSPRWGRRARSIRSTRQIHLTCPVDHDPPVRYQPPPEEPKRTANPPHLRTGAMRTGLRQRHDGQIQRSGFRPRKHNRIVRVEQIELFDPLHRRHGLERHAARFGFDSGGDLLSFVEPRGWNLHHATAVVRHEEVFVAVLAVHDHVERPVAIPEFGNRRPHDFARPAAGC